MKDDQSQEVRIGPLAQNELDVVQTAIVRDIFAAGATPPNVIMTFVRHPDLCKAWLEMGITLSSRGHLCVRDRELVILRVAWNADSKYEWHQHASLRARAAGLTAEDVERLTLSSDSLGWSDWDRSVIKAADEACGTSNISDESWSILSARYTERQMMEFVFLCAQYRALAFILNTLRVPIDGTTD